MLSQAIICVLGWSLEWTEIIVVFVPIFLPLLKPFTSTTLWPPNYLYGSGLGAAGLKKRGG